MVKNEADIAGEAITVETAKKLFDAIKHKHKGWIKELCDYIKENKTARVVKLTTHQIDKGSGWNIARKAKDYGCTARYNGETHTVIIASKPT